MLEKFLKEFFGMVFGLFVVSFLIASMLSNLFPFNTVLVGEQPSHTELCQGCRVVAERQECHNLPKIPVWNVLCAGAL
jgi:hypothetical protein